MQIKTDLSNANPLDLNVLNVRRVFPGTREEIFRAWTDPVELAKWWWPPKWQTVYEIDLQVGGAYCFHTDKATGLGSLSVRGNFLEVLVPGKLVYTWRFDGEGEGETRVTVTFKELTASAGQPQQTEVVILQEGFEDSAQMENHKMGWISCLDRLTPAVFAS